MTLDVCMQTFQALSRDRLIATCKVFLPLVDEFRSSALDALVVTLWSKRIVTVIDNDVVRQLFARLLIERHLLQFSDRLFHSLLSMLLIDFQRSSPDRGALSAEKFVLCFLADYLPKIHTTAVPTEILNAWPNETASRSWLDICFAILSFLLDAESELRKFVEGDWHRRLLSGGVAEAQTLLATLYAAHATTSNGTKQ
jgi:hypothetical protein